MPLAINYGRPQEKTGELTTSAFCSRDLSRNQMVDICAKKAQSQLLENGTATHHDHIYLEVTDFMQVSDDVTHVDAITVCFRYTVTVR